MRRWFRTAIILSLSLVGCFHVAKPAPPTSSSTPENPVVASPHAPATALFTPSASPRSPSAEPVTPIENNKQRGDVYLESAQVLVKESRPAQIVLALQGHLPTPCHALQVVVQPPDAQNRILVEVYSLFEEGNICAQVLAPFDAQVPLGEYPLGRYTIIVNDEVIGEFAVGSVK